MFFVPVPVRAYGTQAFRLNGELSHRLADGAPFLASCGIYVFDKQFLLRLLRENPRAHNFGADVLPLVSEGAKVERRQQQQRQKEGRAEGWRRGGAKEDADNTLRGAEAAAGIAVDGDVPYRVLTWRLHGYWADVGSSLRTFMDSNLDCCLRSPGSDSPFDQFAYHDLVLTGALALPPTDMLGCHITRSAISPGGRISGATISGSLVGPRAVIGPGALIRDSVLMGADYYEEDMESTYENTDESGLNAASGPPLPAMGIGAGSIVEGALIDKNARIGKNCTITNRAGIWEAMDRVGMGLCIREGVPIVTKSAVLYDGTEL
ncbi:hypothetical protein Vretimale_10347 [Volvox reticuliferus]|uniref:glucose-1-phosphate adenylyltransferase n=1 Tax=Volvox reticuliferus TaxID=1737510 RepID=A0A8J4GF88_9CHLO|nr:hypothetical protein Vretimale_10347 [Volvox reticuliferus]